MLIPATKSLASWHSTVTRTVLNGKNAYVKSYGAGGWNKPEGVVLARLKREAEVIERVRMSGLFQRHLGTLHLLEVDPEQSRIATEEVAGRPLQDWLSSSDRRSNRRQLLRAQYLAGRWLRQFQRLPTTESDKVQVSSLEPCDLREYCRVRLDALEELGYTWPDPDFRSKLDATLQRLLAEAAEDDRRCVLGHGDLHVGNILWDGEKLTVIDFGMVSLKVPLADVATFLHRLELLRVYFPWKRWPIGTWGRAFLRGYGRPNVQQAPAFEAQRIRLWLCRLHSFVARPATTFKDRLQNAWIRRCAWGHLISAVSKSA